MNDNQEESYGDEISNGTNARSVKCKYCPSIILVPTSGHYVQSKFQLPTVTQKKAGPSLETEDVSSFWQVDDMFTFQNVGFSNTVGNNKFLTCADCDMGPIGYHDLETKKSYVALCRVDHV